ncbi:hypothetical protein DACRYDRAFT_84732 [Dacryopinax primogenitus]|uniref:Glycerophosphocholine acyltransferase 1 n=1 Tax=Dacryopinax primogenitus (strain DJM 731) TaxID=1858805 RepID=M5FWD8_DACPD|nr:uncharacterized protein DACRYDRAFT_84732 [Dacryopinax primogenitus]EJT97701.1 hypothetical protein DACRYDRAFT_84732 [Dacryopinax primogenitus]
MAELKLPPPPRPGLIKTLSGTAINSLTAPFNEDGIGDWQAAFTLLDTIETYFDSHFDLLERRFKKTSDRLRSKASEALAARGPGRTPFEKELRQFRVKIAGRISSLYDTWHSSKVVRLKGKVSFFIGVQTVLISALIFGMAPEWIPFVYTVQMAYSFPYRVYTFKKKAWHYFLFDLCYYVNLLNMVFIWFMPQSKFLFQSCYLLSHGPIASAVITWRNSLVFHDAEKIMSLFIHFYPPFVFTVIRHYYPHAEERFPALVGLDTLSPWKALLLSGFIYTVWQGLYWKFIVIDRGAKISAGKRTTSFSYMLNDKRGIIGRMLRNIPPAYKEPSFMGGQLVYSLLTELPAVFLMYNSRRWSAVFLMIIFSVATWNGGGYYIEVFGRKFERELEALRKELAEASAAASNVSGSPGPSSPPSEAESQLTSPVIVASDIGFSPVNVPSDVKGEGEGEVETLDLSELHDERQVAQELKKDQ